MSYSRRHIIKGGVALAAMSGVPHPLWALLQQRPSVPLDAPPIEDPIVKRLSNTSLAAARAAGASYADVRLTHTYTRRIADFPAEQESMTFGVRALVDGYWGFAASPVWNTDEAARLGRAAVRQAKANILGKPRVVELAPVAPVANGHWVTPIKDDPFAISPDEISDYLSGLLYFLQELPGVTPNGAGAEFVKQDKAFASTAEQYCTQRLYRASGKIAFRVTLNDRSMAVTLDCLTPTGAGFEYFRDQPLRDKLVKLYEETKEELMLPAKPLDVGRYNVIFDAESVANIVSSTVGAATELDRALGYEANAGGTSYINEPLEMVGTLKMGVPTMTVTANRSEAGGAATVQWDDEGVAPQDFTLVKDGTLADMQTTREGGGWFKAYYEKHQMPVASRGCSHAPDAILPALARCANLELKAGSEDATFDTLITNMRKGIVFKRASVDMDFQQVTGFGTGAAYEVKDGRRVASLPVAGMVFRAQELWNAVTVTGGVGSRRRFGITATKGQPAQIAYHSVTAVPLELKNIAVIDTTRRS